QRVMDARVQREQERPALRLPRSIAFRLALLYGVVFAASAAALIALVYVTTTTSLTQQRDQAISDELGELKSELMQPGASMKDVEREIVVRDNAPDKSQYIYVLYDDKGNLLAGSPAKLVRVEGWSEIATKASDGSMGTTRFRTALLPGAYLLAVGED